MPGYISHTVMAKDVYNKLKNKNVSLEYMMTYSLGGDLCKFAKCRYDSHHKDMDKFIYNMADYMKNNDLIHDRACLGVLYAHICHYMMDDTVHPLVRKISKICIKNKKNHTWVEEYYNDYLVKKVFNKELSNYVREKILCAKRNKRIAKMIDDTYIETYNTSHVSWYYVFNLNLYRIERKLMYIKDNKWYKLQGLNKFIEKNSNIDLVNNNKKIKYNDYNGEECSDDLIELYNKSIDRTVKYIKEVDQYLKK